MYDIKTLLEICSNIKTAHELVCACVCVCVCVFVMCACVNLLTQNFRVTFISTICFCELMSHENNGKENATYDNPCLT